MQVCFPCPSFPPPSSLTEPIGRTRRVKCDATKPTCLRCAKAGRECGYADGGARGLSTSIVPMCAAVDADGRRATASSSLETQRLVMLACASLHSGALQQGGAASSFWSFTLPQLCHTHPAVSTSAAALGAAIERHRDCLSHEHLGLRRRYGQALAAIRHALNDEDLHATPLFAASLLLAMSETLGGQELHALVHLEGALNVLIQRQQQRAKPNSSPGSGLRDAEDTNALQTFTIRDEVDAAGAVMDISTASYALGLLPRLSHLDPDPESWVFRPGGTFVSLEMRALQTLHTSFCFAAAQNRWKYVPYRFRPAELGCQQNQLAEQLFRLAKDLDSIVDASQPGEWRRSRYLSMQCRSCLIYISCLFEPAETSYDRFIEEFRDIICSALMLHGTWIPLSVPHSFDFSLDLGVVQPLFFTSMKCRDPHLRRQAVQCLEHTHREGPFDAKHLAVVARRVIELEETGGREDCFCPTSIEDSPISEPLRLHGAGIDTDLPSDPERNYVEATFSRCRDVFGMMREDTEASFNDKKWWDIWNERLRASTDD